ncbi:unnamed protein product [Didymodactylos carnosus]|uniref:histone acetyltransferase n=1 Tax=Didymodactylos carnosus TaxID=1234261 RepID=A0A815CRB2_9BILA|nr:unnamed protein product [Didymodactylos carnosus]CAF4096495.1 unnamed protein product [Didymodactylos carnosus]
MIAYLDTVQYFKPKEYRRRVYFELLIGYLEYMKELGFKQAYIWASPPGKGNDYILNTHPKHQHNLTQSELVEWYKKLFRHGIGEGVIKKIQNIKEEILSDYKIGDEMIKLPYMDGDNWPGVIEEKLITMSNAKSAKTNEEMKLSLSIYLRDLFQKHAEEFFFLHLNDAVNTSPTTRDDNEQVDYQLFSSRELFLDVSSQHHWEFTNVRRAKFSTICIIHELTKLPYRCDKCYEPCICVCISPDNALELCEKCSNHTHLEKERFDNNQVTMIRQTPITTMDQQSFYPVRSDSVSEAVW